MNIEQKVQLALEEIRRGSSEIIDFEYIAKLITNFYTTGTHYKVKAGFDPTAPDLHLGHVVLLQKLATFQKFGGIVQFLIGDFTATIGDPTGKNETRKILSLEQVLENAKSYTTQVFKILDPQKTEIVFNSSWLQKLGSAGIVELMMHLTVARMLERDDFSNRFKSNKPIAVSEFTYPLLQGYDSVVLQSDIEIGGTDQKFNLLMGRQLQKIYNIGKEQAVLMMPILEGLDGVLKMSKSLNNYIAIDDTPKEMFGKILSISDVLMWRYYELLSSKSLQEIKQLEQDVIHQVLHPKSVKENLAIEICDRFHGIGSGINAQKDFNEIFKYKNLPTTLECHEMCGPVWICQAMVDSKIESSTSQARRDIMAGAVKINEEKVLDDKLILEYGEYTIQKGKKSFVRVVILQKEVD